MATLTQDKPRRYSLNVPSLIDAAPAVASDIIYEGAAVGDSAGYGRPLVGGDVFRGFANRRCDNSVGAAGDLNIEVNKQGEIELAVTNVAAVTDEGSTVYATDDDTFTLSSTGGTAIGKVSRFIAAGKAMVFYQAASVQSL